MAKIILKAFKEGNSTFVITEEFCRKRIEEQDIHILSIVSNPHPDYARHNELLTSALSQKYKFETYLSLLKSI